MVPSPTRRELQTLVRLATPIVLTQLCTMAMGAIDVMMLGHYSSHALAAGSMGRAWAMGTQLVAQGVLFGIDPLVAQAHGARDARGAGLAFQRGLVLAVLISVPLVVSWLFTAEALVLLESDPTLPAPAEVYTLGRIPGVLPYLVFMAMRGWLQGRGILRPALLVALVANVLNFVANWALIWGVGPIPELGVLGAGLATSITQFGLLGGLVWLVLRFRLARGGWTGWSREAWNVRAFGGVLAIGIPIGLQLGLEVWAFEISHFFSARLGATEAAAFAVVMTISSLAFMVPLGIGIGAQTRVGNLIGAGRPDRAGLAARVALRAGAACMLVFAVVLIVGDRVLPLAFSGDVGVVMYAAVALPITGLFQLFDGVQVIACCILRGAGRARLPVLFNLLAYYGVGLPLGWLLAFRLGWGFPGVWLGLAAGLGVAAPLLVAMVARVFAGDGPAALER